MKKSWYLPVGFDEILPPKSLKIEKLKRVLIDLYISSGYEYIIPPLLEFSETLGGEAHEELEAYAFSFADNLSEKQLSFRPDLSEQAARIDAHRFNTLDPVRLCYVGDILKKKISQIHRSRTTIQVGAEIFGDPSLEADLESMNLMIEGLRKVGVKEITLSIGHAGLTSFLFKEIKKSSTINIDKVESVLSKKSESDIRALSSEELTSEQVNMLLDLSKLYGGTEVIETAKSKLSVLDDEIIHYLDYLESLIENLQLNKKIKLHIDLGEVYGFRYHNGVVFSAYIDKAGYPLAKGGRYDGISKTEDLLRPAVGFDLDILAIAEHSNLDLESE